MGGIGNLHCSEGAACGQFFISNLLRLTCIIEKMIINFESKGADRGQS